ncbi:unnamed protein product [Rotaria sp. Silwood2]|nr:unnamed protein product [Rotaria sp. Silwood2]
MPHYLILSILSTQQLISNETTFHTIYVHLYIYLIYFYQAYLYDLCDDYFCTWFNKNDLITSLISYYLCKSGILLGQTTKE